MRSVSKVGLLKSILASTTLSSAKNNDYLQNIWELEYEMSLGY